MKRLLVAIDATDNSTFVLARAIELATALDAKLRLFTAVEMPPIVPAPPTGPFYTPPTNAVTEAEATLRELEQRIPPALRDGITVDVGGAWETVCAVARSYEADLVVIGAHRHGVFARMLGTTAAKITNHVDRPVIIVRPLQSELEASGPKPAAFEGAPPSTGRKHNEHRILEATTLAGGAVGAALGAAAGPPGALVGGVIGLGVGLLTGDAIEDEPQRAGLRAGALLRSDHQRLEKIYDDLLFAYRSGEWEQVRAQWAVFEPAVRAHMDMEEQAVFPELRAVNREEADALLAHHAELRRLLGTLGVAIDLHGMPLRDAQELIACLRAHGAREEKVLYPWMDEVLDASKLRHLSSAPA